MRRNFPPRRGPAGGSTEGASNETEIACAPRGLGRGPSSESEIVPQPARPRRGRTMVLGRGPSVRLGFLHLKGFGRPGLDAGATSEKETIQVPNPVLRV